MITQTTGKQRQSKSKFKLYVVIAIVIIAIGSLGIIWFFSSSESTVAQLVIDMGIVEIKRSGGEWTAVQSGILLYPSDAIRTKDNSTATIILFESSIIRLDTNTEIKLEKVIREHKGTDILIKQESGRTWNTILKISGIDTYEVHTPTAVASVRGTSFYVQINENETVEVGVTRGIVNVTRILNNETIDFILVIANTSVTIDPSLLPALLKLDPLVLTDWVLQNIQKDQDFIVQVKDDLYDRIEQYIPELKEMFGITDEELEVLIDGYLDGYYDLPSDTPEWVREIIEVT